VSFPKNPETIVIKNNFYPKGLKEIDIWNYYQKNKNLILNETKLRQILFFIAIDTNRFVVSRKYKGEPIFLNMSTYDKFITGRTISIHSTMRSINPYGIIDIDIDNFKMAKEATSNVYYEMLKCKFVDSLKIKYTGKESFHIICYFKRPLKMEFAKDLLKNYLKESEALNDYDILGKRKKGIVNLDLSPNKLKGSYITLGSLSILGLRAMEVKLQNLKYFKKEQAKI
jgi:hypothetical protein